MTTTVTSITISDVAIGITVTSCIAFFVMILLSNEKKSPNLEILNRSLIVFTIPLLIIFSYLAILKVLALIAG